MEKKQFEQLEKLMSELQHHLKHRCCVVNGPHDGFIIAIYDNETGEKKNDAISYSIENCVKKLTNGQQDKD